MANLIAHLTGEGNKDLFSRLTQQNLRKMNMLVKIWCQLSSATESPLQILMQWQMIDYDVDDVVVFKVSQFMMTSLIHLSSITFSLAVAVTSDLH